MTKRPSIQAKLQQSQPAADPPQAAKIQSASAGAASTSSIAAHYPVEAQSGIDPEKAPENLAIIEALAMGFLAIL